MLSEQEIKMTFEVELTDTFGGDANYAWVKRATFEAPTDASDALLMRRAKALVGITGCRGVKSCYGDSIEFRPYGLLQVMFLNPRY